MNDVHHVKRKVACLQGFTTLNLPKVRHRFVEVATIRSALLIGWPS